MKAEVLDNRLDRWLQRGAVATMVAVAIALVALGLTIYGQPLSPSAVEGVPAGLSAVEGPRELGKQVGPGTDNLTLTSTTSR